MSYIHKFNWLIDYFQIFIDQIAVEHIRSKNSPTEDTSSAPKDFEIYVSIDNNRFLYFAINCFFVTFLQGVRGDLVEFSLGKYRFDNHPVRSLQHFTVIANDRIEYLRFTFESNHGHPNYTCIYR